MKINYLRTFQEDERVSMDNYAKDMILDNFRADFWIPLKCLFHNIFEVHIRFYYSYFVNIHLYYNSSIYLAFSILSN